MSQWLDEKQRLTKGILLTIAYAFVMSLTGVVAKQVQLSIAVPVLVFWQSLFCVLVLYPQLRGRWQPRSVTIWKIHFLRSVGGFTGFLFYYWALNHIPLVEATLLRYCAPLCVPFVVLIMHKTSVPKSRWLPLLIGFSGVVCIIQPTPEQLNPWHLIGFLSAIGLAFSMVTTRMLSHQVSSEETMMVYFLISAGLSLGLALLQGESLLLPMPAWPLVAVVSITLYVGMFLYTKAYSYAPASVVSPVSYAGVVFSGLWGWLVWGHLPDVYAYAGMLLIFLSILISTRMAKKQSG
ncbi:DMT family transporter [Marinomonas pollencensis]|uniref:Drug/metabolite transporter (DMT)-like permease n=1 Tax=Marinomonas pollencensis TaxID=491954 RepID=A0A3E0DVZ3_9GAMM|nr:DMT family transporter [Marinomonas pollencensis]REG86995.1 drug/metabolite transporter (DMT)-like permease [Marinomonas pollencensis]